MKGALPVAVGPAHSSGEVWKYWGTLEGLQGQLLSDDEGDEGRNMLPARASKATAHVANAAVKAQYVRRDTVIWDGFGAAFGVGMGSSFSDAERGV